MPDDPSDLHRVRGGEDRAASGFPVRAAVREARARGEDAAGSRGRQRGARRARRR